MRWAEVELSTRSWASQFELGRVRVVAMAVVGVSAFSFISFVSLLLLLFLFMKSLNGNAWRVMWKHFQHNKNNNYDHYYNNPDPESLQTRLPLTYSHTHINMLHMHACVRKHMTNYSNNNNNNSWGKRTGITGCCCCMLLHVVVVSVVASARC